MAEATSGLTVAFDGEDKMAAAGFADGSLSSMTSPVCTGFSFEQNRKGLDPGIEVCEGGRNFSRPMISLRSEVANVLLTSLHFSVGNEDVAFVVTLKSNLQKLKVFSGEEGGVALSFSEALIGCELVKGVGFCSVAANSTRPTVLRSLF